MSHIPLILECVWVLAGSVAYWVSGQKGAGVCSIDLLKTAVSLDSLNGATWFQLGVACEQQQRFREALDAFQNAEKFTVSRHVEVMALEARFVDCGQPQGVEWSRGYEIALRCLALEPNDTLAQAVYEWRVSEKKNGMF